MTKTTTPADAAQWADAQVRRHTRWPLDILGTGPQCTGLCHQGRALCPHPEACGVQHPVLDDAQLAPAEELQAEPQRKPLLSPAGWFWLVYAVGFASALLGLNFAGKLGWLS